MTFDKHSIPELKAIAKEHGIKGYSALSKGPLVKLLKKHLKMTKSGIEKKSEGGAVRKPLGSDPATWSPSGGAVPPRPALRRQTNNPDHTARKLRLLKNIHAITGGQLPSRITEKMKKLEIEGGDLCDDKPECRTGALAKGPCKKEAKRMNQSDPMGDPSGYYAAEGKFSKCKEEQRKKMGCPPKCTTGKKPSGAMKLLSKVSDKLLKGTNKVVAGLIVAGEPAFLTACGAAGSAMGGPPGGALSAAACAALYKKMMVDDAGSDVYVKKELNDKEIGVLNFMGKMGAGAGKRAAGGNVVSGPGGSSSPGGMGVSDKIDWEDMNWGSFTEQLQQYNRTHKKNMTLKELAEHVLADPSKFKEKTKKRARFYLNVILKKK